MSFATRTLCALCAAAVLVGPQLAPVARADEAADVAAACEYVENEMGMAQLAASMQMAYDNGLALGKTSSLVACAAQDLNFCGKPNFNACNEEAENPIFLNCPGLCGCCNFGDADRNMIVEMADIIRAVDFIIGTAVPTDCEFSLSDVNEDGVVNILDVVGIIGLLGTTYQQQIKG